MIYKVLVSYRRIIAPFMYKVYINGLWTEINNHRSAVVINRLALFGPSFADDISLLTLYPSFLHTFVDDSYDYSLKLRYEFNHTKSGTIIFSG